MPNGTPRKLLPIDLKSMCRAYTERNIQALGLWATSDSTEPEFRLKAIQILLERGHGRPAQPHTGEDGEGGIELIIRDMLAERKAKQESGE